MKYPIFGLPLNAYVQAIVIAMSFTAIVALVLPRRLNLVKFLAGAVVAAAVFVAGTFPILDTVGHFGVIHLVYDVLTVFVPVAGLALLARVALRRGSKWFAAVGALALVPGVLGFYATNIEPQMLEVNAFDVKTDLKRPVRVGVIADIQSPSVGAHEREAVAGLAAQRPDIVLIPGDSYWGEDLPMPKHMPAFTTLLKGLTAPGGVFVVHGDHDGDGWLPKLTRDSGHRLLDNQVAVSEVNGQRIAILGIQNDHAATDAVAAMKRLPSVDADYRIVLAHHPDAIQFVPPGVDLVVSGHTHGGQVQLPVIGPLLTLSSIPREQAAGGLFAYPHGQLFVTRGVGVEHGPAPIVRFNAKPEVNVLTLAPTST